MFRRPRSRHRARRLPNQLRFGRLLALTAAGLLLSTSAGADVCVSDAEPLRTVLLGDSYTAGNGAGAYAGADGCYRSTANYGHRFVSAVRASGVAASKPVTAACSGATTKEVLHESVRSDMVVMTRYRQWGPPSRDTVTADLAAACTSAYRTRLDFDEFSRRSGAARLDVLQSVLSFFSEPAWVYSGTCERRANAQVDAVTETTDVVLMTIGGNDAGFSQVVTSCFVGPALVPLGGSCAGTIDQARRFIGSSEPTGFTAKLTDTLTAVRERLPASSRLVLLAYPYLDDGTYLSCRLVVAGRCIGQTDAGKQLRDLGDLGDATQRQVVAKLNGDGSGGAHIDYFDGTKALFAGHEPTGSRTTANPDGWIWELPQVRTIKDEYYHPTATGHAAEGAAVAAAEHDWLVTLPCQETPTVVTFDVAPVGAGSDFAAGRPARVIVGGTEVLATTTDATGRLTVPAAITAADATVELDTPSGRNCGSVTTHRWEHVALAGQPLTLSDQLTRSTCL